MDIKRKNKKGGVFSVDQTYLDNELAIKKINSDASNPDIDEKIKKEQLSELAVRYEYKKLFDEKRKLDLDGNAADIDLKRAQADLLEADTKLKRLEKSKIYHDTLAATINWYLDKAYAGLALVGTKTVQALNLPFKALNSKAVIGVGTGVGHVAVSTVSGTIGVFIKVAMPYIVLFIVIALILGMALSYSNGGSHNLPNFSSGSAGWLNPLSWIDNLRHPTSLFPSFTEPTIPVMTSWFSIPSSWKVLARRLSGEPPAGLKRKEEGGRCDEALYKEYESTDNGVKLCGRTNIDFPDDIVYSLTAEDVSNIVASPTISENLKSCVKKVSQIRIPYKLNSNKDSFIPACSLAKFDNGESAAKLFDPSAETDTTCQFL